MQKISVKTNGEGFYDITATIKAWVPSKKSGILTIFCPHTSCGLTLNEACDPSACDDMVSFLKHLAPRNLSFIRHTAEGPDDSPSHMKSMLLQHSIQIIVENGEFIMGRWQGLWLAEFRDAPHERHLILKFMEG